MLDGTERSKRADLHTYIANNFSTSVGVTNPWTKISGGVCCPINEARSPRSVAAPEARGDQHTQTEETGEMVVAEASELTFLEIAFICISLRA